MNNTNNLSARNSYDVAKQILYASWINSFKQDSKQCMDWVNSRKLSQSEIRLEVELNNSGTNFVFGMTPNQSNSSNVVFATEQRLQLQDSLIVSEYGIFIGDATSSTDIEYALHTYGNPTAFTPAQANALNQNFYNSGAFRMDVNNDVIIPYRGLLNHYYVPQTQQVAAVAAGTVQDQVRGAEDGFITQEPNVLLIGSKNYRPQIVLKTALSAAAAGTRAVLIFRGILAQNSTVIN